MAARAPGKFAIGDGQTVVFIGDSLTDTDRRADHYPLGWGYVRMAIDLVTAKYPERSITFYNRGIAGDTARGLRDRWQDDVLSLRPDWVSVLIGINDVHRRFRPNPEEHIPPDLYREAYEDCLARTAQQTSARLILMDPFYISRETDQPTDRGCVLSVLPDYIAIVREMADRFSGLHVPLHEIFQKHLAYRPADHFCPEPVHPNITGHRVIAQAWLAAVAW